MAMLFVLGMMSKQGKALGIFDGRLHPCSDKPNCVCSEYITDREHYHSPLPFLLRQHPHQITVLKEIISTMGGIVQHQQSMYISATFSSPIFGFVDDLEIRIDVKNSVIHIRSASRVGHSDLGMNQKRVELLKKLYQEQMGNK